MTEIKAPELVLLFRPDAFFLKPWRGWGVVRDGRGRSIDRYTAFGQGKAGSRSATTRQTFEFESGLVHTVEWDILTDDESHYFARDLKTGVEARGHAIGPDFCWMFLSETPGPLGKLVRARTTARYTLVTEQKAFSFTEVRRFGRLMRTFTTFYEQL